MSTGCNVDSRAVTTAFDLRLNPSSLSRAQSPTGISIGALEVEFEDSKRRIQPILDEVCNASLRLHEARFFVRSMGCMAPSPEPRSRRARSATSLQDATIIRSANTMILSVRHNRKLISRAGSPLPSSFNSISGPSGHPASRPARSST